MRTAAARILRKAELLTKAQRALDLEERTHGGVVFVDEKNDFACQYRGFGPGLGRTCKRNWELGLEE
jgi:hypothetical protein